MTHVHEISEKTFRNARRLMAVSSLASIRLTKSIIDASRFSLAAYGSNKVVYEIGTKSRIADLSEAGLRVEVVFSFKATSSAESKDLLKVNATFELVYGFPADMSDGPVLKGEAQAFAETNVLINVWPYWREYVQTSLARMNLPPLSIPLFRLQPMIEKEQGRAAIPAKSRPAGKTQKRRKS